MFRVQIGVAKGVVRHVGGSTTSPPLSETRVSGGTRGVTCKLGVEVAVVGVVEVVVCCYDCLERASATELTSPLM